MPVAATVPAFLAGAYDTGTIEGPLFCCFLSDDASGQFPERKITMILVVLYE